MRSSKGSECRATAIVKSRYQPIRLRASLTLFIGSQIELVAYGLTQQSFPPDTFYRSALSIDTKSDPGRQSRR